MMDSAEDLKMVECCHPHIIYRTGQSELKGEDVLFVEHCRPWPGSEGGTTSHSQQSLGSLNSMELDSANTRWVPEDFPPSCPTCGTPTNSYSLYCIFDGHNGVHAAKMAGESVLAILESRLPWGAPPPSTHSYFTKWREWVQLALVETMTELNHVFSQRGIQAGCTATMVLQVGWLITAVNLGDSRAMLDTGAEIIPLSEDHRVATHRGERKRVEAMGAIIAPISMSGSGPANDYNNGVGPLRIWPGGLCLSRAIGDFDVGDSVIPFPHVTQVLLPSTGGRIIVASDGVWDAFDKMTRASTMSRSWPIDQAPSRMVQTIVRAYGGLKDDTSLVIIDTLTFGTTFAQVAGKRGSKSASVASDAGNNTGGGGGGCLCFGAPKTVEPPSDPSVTMNNDISVRSMSSYSSNPSVKGGVRPRALVLANYDVASVMGLMPETELEHPGWYTAEIGEQLFKAAADAMRLWREAHEKRYARPPTTPMLPDMPRPRRKSRKVGFLDEEADGQQEGGMSRVGSVAFTAAIAESGEEYARKFGHYKKQDNGNVNSHYLAEPSVRAGQQYIGDQSVRAGNQLRAIKEDPSVRIRGSDMDKSVHMTASKLKTQDSDGLVPVRVVKLGK